MKNLSHGTPCAVKAACTVWTGAKGSKESDLSVFLFRYEYSANFFYKLWKRIRNYNGLITGNIGDPRTIGGTVRLTF